ncbi:hypothetical protein KIN20_036272 [Parelaphostrongylus tenuis]|uniref:Polyprotein allergen nematode domain-containing protein n=1 Tax=Parelaphostrongylus tenuis TaxID=148309 RepID=A0AAD5RCB4_PARTN|nr:hypothetical protein KIN20_036272 [Parelaphostrongylus tenuis]
MLFAQSKILMSVVLNTVLLLHAERRLDNTNAHMGRKEIAQSKNKYVQNLLFSSKLWLSSDQSEKLKNLQIKGDNEAVVRELEEYYRNLDDKTRATLRIQSACRAILSEEINQSSVDELITMKTKMATSLELVNKVKSLFQSVKRSDISIIEPLCVAAYENSHVPTVNDSRQLSKGKK